MFLKGPELLKEHYDAKEYGVKSKKGFYDYSDGKDEETIAKKRWKILKAVSCVISVDVMDKHIE